MSEGNKTYRPVKELAAVCGLFCPACFIFIAQREGPDTRKLVAESLNLPVEYIKCDGCRAENRFIYCENNCRMVPCAAEKGVDFCGECDEYPCEILKEFQAARPHRIELWPSLERIREVGHEKWFYEMLKHYSCHQCGTVNSAYHSTCRECGADPSCEYVKRHKSEIERRPSMLKSS